jgi:hypothetical protein
MWICQHSSCQAACCFWIASARIAPPLATLRMQHKQALRHRCPQDTGKAAVSPAASSICSWVNRTTWQLNPGTGTLELQQEAIRPGAMSLSPGLQGPQICLNRKCRVHGSAISAWQRGGDASSAGRGVQRAADAVPAPAAPGHLAPSQECSLLSAAAAEGTQPSAHQHCPYSCCMPCPGPQPCLS